MNECRIIEDLLPLYTDGLLQEDTAEFVKLHLVRCVACSEKERQLKAVVDVPPPAPKTDKKSRFRRVGRKKRVKAFLISAASVVLAVGIAFGAYFTYDALHRQKVAYDSALSYVAAAHRTIFPIWYISERTGEETGEGIRVRNGNLVLYLPDVGFRRVEEGYYVRYVEAPESDSLYATSSIRFFEEPMPSLEVASLKNIHYAYMDGGTYQYFNRGFELFQELNITNRLELVDYYLNFDYQSLAKNPSKDQLALGVFLVANRSNVLQNYEAIGLSNAFSGYILFRVSYDRIPTETDYVSQETREWIIYLKNPRSTETVFKISITDTVGSATPSNWICTDYTVMDILSNVQML